MDLFDRLRQAVLTEWAAYVDHPFVRMMGDGTLPEPAFRRYLEQDYLFLIQFARANALAVYKSRTLTDMREAQAALGAILDQEMDLHVRLCGRWDLAPEELERAPEHPATVAYTRFVLDCGQAGDLLDLHVALAPCVIGYAEIAGALLPTLHDDHPYREWIADYAGHAYQGVAARARAHLDRLAQHHLAPARFDDLARTFATACRLEADFWQMGLGATGRRGTSGG